MSCCADMFCQSLNRWDSVSRGERNDFKESVLIKDLKTAPVNVEFWSPGSLYNCTETFFNTSLQERQFALPWKDSFAQKIMLFILCFNSHFSKCFCFAIIFHSKYQETQNDFII